MINDDTYPSLVFPGLNCDLEDTGVMCSGCTVLSDSKQTKLGWSDQKAFSSASLNLFLNQ